MIQREELEQILNFVASRWTEATKDPNYKAMESVQVLLVESYIWSVLSRF